MSPRLVRGLSAGAAGTLALSGLVLVRNAALGHPPPYAARRIAARLVGRALQRPLRPPEALGWGLGLRWIYGPLLGLAWARLRAHLPPSRLARGLLLGVGVWALEQLGFPRVRATASARTWTRAEHAFLLAQTVAFGLVTESRLAGRLAGDPGAAECWSRSRIPTCSAGCSLTPRGGRPSASPSPRGRGDSRLRRSMRPGNL